MPFRLFNQASLWKKALFSVGIILAILFVSASIILWTKPAFLSRWVEHVIHEKLQQASQGLYHFEYGDLQIDLPNQSIYMTDFTIHTDSTWVDSTSSDKATAPRFMFNFKAKEVTATHFSALSLLLWNNLKINQIRVAHSTLHVRVSPTDSTASTTSSPTPENTIKRLLIDHILIEDASVVVVNPLYRNELQASVHHLSVQLHHINVRPDQLWASNKIWGADQLSLAAQRIELPSRDNLYTCILDSVQLESKDSIFTIERLRYLPIDTKRDFFAKVQNAKTRMDLQFRHIQSQGVQVNHFVNTQEIAVRHLTFAEANLEFYKDKHYPKLQKNFIGHYPHQLLLKAPFTVSVDSLTVQNTSIQYCELGNTTEKEGCISFDQTAGTIYHITNHPDRIAQKAVCQARLRTQFMNSSPLQAYFTFSLDRKDGHFACRGVLNDFAMPRVNNFVISLARVSVQSGTVNKLDFTIQATDYESTIDMEMLYYHLKVNLFKEPKNGNGLKKRKFLMKIVNNVLIEQDNPKEGEAARTAKTTVKRETNQPFFNIIWTTIQAAIVQIVLGKKEK